MMTPEQRVYGMLGLLVGDALGVPYEFTKPEGIPPFKEIEYEPPAGFQKAYGVPAGTWSDDGAQALCVLDALLASDDGGSFVDAVGHRLLAWRGNGLWAVDRHVFDIGNTTNAALNRLHSGVPALEAGMIGERYKSNGSLMRTLPLAFLNNDDELVRAAMGQSKVTHAEIEPMLCCAVYCLWAKHLAQDVITDPTDNGVLLRSWDKAFDTLHTIVPKGILTPFIEIIHMWPDTPTGEAYVVNALYSAKQALERGTDFESTVRIAIQFGHDTDTTAAIAGGLAGIRYQSIPQRWLDGLRGKEMLEPLFLRLRDFDG